MNAARVALLALVATGGARAASASPDGGADGAGTEVPAASDGRTESTDAGVAGARDGSTQPARGAVLETSGSLALRGRALEKGTRRPLKGASITLDGTPAGETDGDGRFELLTSPGPHHVQLQLPAHEIVDRRVEVARGAGEEVFRLPPRLTGERYETTVRAAHAEAPHLEISGDEARKTPGTSGDPLRVLASLPGVSQIVWPAALFVVRGANPGNTGFFLDGMRVPALFHLALGPSIVHPYLIEGVDFFPGGFPVAYGGAVAGIVAARTAQAPTDRVHAAADVTLFDAGGIMTAPWDEGHGSVAVAARYSYSGALLSALSEDIILRYGDYQVRADHPFAGGHATVFAFGSLDNLGWTDLPETTKEYASLQFHRLDLRWQAGVGGGRLAVALTGGVDWSQSTLFARPIKSRAVSAAPRLSYEHALGSSLDLQVGADGDAQAFVTEVPMFQPRASDLARSRTALSQALFAALSIRAGRRLVVVPGIRGDLFVEEGTRRFAAEPRLDATLALSDRLALKLSGGRFVQMPTLPVSVPGFESFGLADLGLQTSLGGSLGVEARLRHALFVSVTGYAQRLRVTDVRNIDLVMPDPAAPDFLVPRRGRATGVELLIRRADEGRLFGWLAYTLSWSSREDDNGVFGRSDWDQRHILNLVTGYRLRGGYSVGARFHYNTGRYAAVFNSGGQYQPLPAFYELDLRADRRFVLDRFVLDVFVDVANATLTRQVVQLETAHDPATGELVVQQGSFLLILPTVGVHAEF
jgi:hypothetical protein